jgi:transposase
VPPGDIRRRRTHARYRRRLTQARAAEKQRVEKLLEDAHLTLSSVISDIRGVSGRDMLRVLAAGERSPRVLAELARGVMRRKLVALREALDCSFFTEEHAFVLAMMLDNIDHYSAQIATLCRPYQRQVAQLDQIPGFGVTNAQDLIGEIGAGMTVFPTAGYLCSWARVAPRIKEPGGKRKGGSATGEGSPCIGAALGEAAVSAGRTQTFLGAKLRRLVRHMPKKKAQGAVMRTQLVIAHALLSDPEADYRELGPGYYDQQAGTRRQARGHIRSLECLGYKVTPEPVDPDTGELTAKAG